MFKSWMFSDNNDNNTMLIIYYFNTFSILLTILSQWRFNVSDNIAYKLFQYNYILYTILIRYQFWVHKTLNSIYDFAISILYTFKQYWFNIVDMVWQNWIYQINYCMFTRLVAAHIGRYSMIHISIGAYLSTSGTDMAWYSDTDMVYSIKEN